METEGISDLGVGVFGVGCLVITLSPLPLLAIPCTLGQILWIWSFKGSDHVHLRGPGAFQTRMVSCGWGEGRGTEQRAGGLVWGRFGRIGHPPGTE